MNQLEILSNIRKQYARDKLMDGKAVYLGDLYIYYNKMYVTIHSYDRYDTMKFHIITDKGNIIDKQSILEATWSQNPTLARTVDIVGFDHIYLDGLSDFDVDILDLYERQKCALIQMKYEYDELVEYINYNLDEILLRGGI